jgi:hypothetical protein
MRRTNGLASRPPGTGGGDGRLADNRYAYSTHGLNLPSKYPRCGVFKELSCGSANGPATAEIKNMNKQWKASRYRYPDGRPRNEDRYKIFVWENGKWVSVGGAIRKWGDKTVAYLCMPAAQRDIRTPRDAERKTEGPLAQVGAGGQHFKTI